MTLRETGVQPAGAAAGDPGADGRAIGAIFGKGSVTIAGVPAFGIDASAVGGRR
jgi:hypothetical protein